ncbi:hypothetical protein HPP92_004232 [Vanilla planifolia]|uniref:Uncharacterized protein n=1 Tax=Vanilla planifolia TaxID=51239 RepID=A0A835VDF6_VANPL|nr:hypothetical protein HPP92_004232 [Vanilla planifolia]
MGSLPVSFGRGRVRPGVRRPTPQGGRVTQSRRGGGPRGNRLGGWSLALQDSVARQAIDDIKSQLEKRERQPISSFKLIQVGFNTKDQDEFTQDVRDNASQVNVYPLQKKSALYFEFVGAPRPTFKKAMADSSGADSPSAQRPPRN